MNLGQGPAPVDHIAGRTGLSGDAVAVLMIVAGVLVILFPKLLALTVGLVLILLGALWLYTNVRRRNAAATAPQTYAPPPPPPAP